MVGERALTRLPAQGRGGADRVTVEETPMRKLWASLAALFFMAGLMVAAEVTVVSYDKDKKEVKVKDDKDAEKTYKVGEFTKVKLTDKDGNVTDGKFEDLENRLEMIGKFGGKGGGKGGKGGKGGGGKGGGIAKLDVTTDGDRITEVKMRQFGFKKDKE
jgi:uncharacterized membrane protein YgcG